MAAGSSALPNLLNSFPEHVLFHFIPVFPTSRRFIRIMIGAYNLPIYLNQFFAMLNKFF